MNTDDESINALTERVIGFAFRVANGLGSGFLEKVYENAMAHELRKGGLVVAQQHVMNVHYDGVVVGSYAADLLVEEALLVELKCTKVLDGIHSAQCLNYLKATGCQVCLLLNFGSPRLEIKRIVNSPLPRLNPSLCLLFLICVNLCSSVD
jgi:GxxExxY protein